MSKADSGLDRRFGFACLAQRRLYIVTLALLGGLISLNAAVTNPGLFSTGVDNQGHILPGGTVDPHYKLIQSPDPACLGPSAFVTSVFPGWVANGPNSQWIAPSLNYGFCAEGTYIYRTTFDLTGIDPSAVIIRGRWTSDNDGVDFRINGSSTGFISPNDAYKTLDHPFTITSGFVGGINTLDFVVFNGTIGNRNPTALRVEFAPPTTLPAPTNLKATQIGNNGTQIKLTWDYGSDAIDGFRIERKTPLAADWEVVPVTLLAGQRAWVDNPPISFATYVYRLRAFAGSELSDPSNEATCFQLKLFAGLGGTAIEAVFEPGESLFGLAQKYGFDHFNWISTVTLVPSTISAPPRPFLDPPLGGYPDRPADSFPYYWDDVFGFDVRYFIGAWMQANTVRFWDSPGYPSGTSLDHMEFKTMLVGVQGPLGSSSWQSKPLASFSWSSNRIGDWGGVYDYRFSNLDPPLTTGPGGIFNAVIVRTEDLPLVVRQFLAQMGVQNISTAPKVDKDAPITAAFLSGQEGANGWYTGPVQVTLIATDIDGPSDIAATSYRLDGGQPTSYTVPFTVSASGTHTVSFASADRALNAEAPQTQSFGIDGTAPSFSCKASPDTLSPADGRSISVALSGSIADPVSGIDSGTVKYAVADEYGQVQPTGVVSVGPQGSYSVMVRLIAGRNANDLDGRKYTILVSGKDKAGNAGSCTAIVTVPLDQGGGGPSQPYDLTPPALHTFMSNALGNRDRSVVFDAQANFTIQSAGVRMDPLPFGATAISVGIWEVTPGGGYLNLGTRAASPVKTATVPITDSGMGFYDVPISFTFLAGHRYSVGFYQAAPSVGWGTNTSMEFYHFGPGQAHDPPYRDNQPFTVGGAVTVLGAGYGADFAQDSLPHIRLTAVPAP